MGRACDSYASRPGMCREYPTGLLDQPSPELLPGCGYRVVARRRDGWLLALQGRGLSEEQLDKVKKGLYLDS